MSHLGVAEVFRMDVMSSYDWLRDNQAGYALLLWASLCPLQLNSPVQGSTQAHLTLK